MPFWYCCIAQPERDAINALSINFVLTLGSPMELDVWNAVWSAAPWGGPERAAAAMAAWSLEYTEIIIPDLPPIPAVGYTDAVAWAALSGVVVAPGPKCPDGCTQPTW